MWWGDIKTMNIWKEKPAKKKEVVYDDAEIDVLSLSNRARNCLARSKCFKISDIIKMIDEDTIKKIRGLGVATETEIRQKLSDYTGIDYVLNCN